MLSLCISDPPMPSEITHCKQSDMLLVICLFRAALSGLCPVADMSTKINARLWAKTVHRKPHPRTNTNEITVLGLKNHRKKLNVAFHCGVQQKLHEQAPIFRRCGIIVAPGPLALLQHPLAFGCP